MDRESAIWQSQKRLRDKIIMRGFESRPGLHNQTRVSFRIFLMGFRNGSPLNFRNSARFLPAPRLRRAGARVKRQVQSEDFWREDFWEGNANAKYSGVFAV